MILRCIKCLGQHFLQKLKVWFLWIIKRAIKRNHGSTIFQTIAGKFELVMCMNVRNREFPGWTIWWLWKPHVQVWLFVCPRFKINKLIARSLVAWLINLILNLATFNFDFLLIMWNQINQIPQKMCMSTIYSFLANKKYSLPILPFLAFWFGISKCSQFIFRINFGHNFIWSPCLFVIFIIFNTLFILDEVFWPFIPFRISAAIWVGFTNLFL